MAIVTYRILQQKQKVFLFSLVIACIPENKSSDEVEEGKQAYEGLCLRWEEGDSLSLNSCHQSSKVDCHKSSKPIAPDKTMFVYDHEPVMQTSQGEILEFRPHSKSSQECSALLRSAARQAERMMSQQWGHFVYSKMLGKGQRAYVYGKNGWLYRKPDSTSQKKELLKDGLQVLIVERSLTQSHFGDHRDPAAYWFLVEGHGKTGWIFGKFLHPDPSSLKSIIQ